MHGLHYRECSEKNAFRELASAPGNIQTPANVSHTVPIKMTSPGFPLFLQNNCILFLILALPGAGMWVKNLFFLEVKQILRYPQAVTHQKFLKALHSLSASRSLFVSRAAFFLGISFGSGSLNGRPKTFLHGTRE
ncbi:MAG: hypothetical protein R2860_05065 [Desulfobacterales bacterium]